MGKNISPWQQEVLEEAQSLMPAEGCRVWGLGTHQPQALFPALSAGDTWSCRSFLPALPGPGSELASGEGQPKTLAGVEVTIPAVEQSALQQQQLQ